MSNRSPAVRPTQLRRKRPPENSAVSWQLAQAARKVASPRPACAAVNTPSSTESAGGGSFAGSVCAARIDAGAVRPRMTVAARVIANAPGRAESLRGRVSWEAAVRFVWSSRSNALPPDWRTFASRALACDDTAPAAGVARKSAVRATDQMAASRVSTTYPLDLTVCRARPARAARPACGRDRDGAVRYPLRRQGRGRSSRRPRRAPRIRRRWRGRFQHSAARARLAGATPPESTAPVFEES